MGTQLLLPKSGRSPPIFGPCLLWPNGWMDQDATWYGSRPRPTQHCARCGPSYPQKKGHTHPHPILVHVYCGQMAGWMKTPLGTEVLLGSGDFLFDGDPATSRIRAHPPHPIFGLCLLWPNGWMDEDAYGSRPRPRHHCTRRGPSSREMGIAAPLFPPLFGPCLLWPRSPISATAELLLR